MNYLALLEEMIEYIEERLNEKIALEDIAKATGYSVYHLIRIFSAATGETIGSYIQKRRLAVAAAELLHTGKAVMEIAMDNGYASPEGFSRAFKSVYGVQSLRLSEKRAGMLCRR